MAEEKSPEKSLEEDRGADGKKKAKKNKGQTWAKEGPRDPFEMLDSLSEEKQQEIQKALHLFSLGQGPPKNLQEAHRYTYRFWDTQPVPKIDEKVTSHGPIESERPSVREEPYSLPKGFIWDKLDLDNQEQLRELCDLLNENYTEEDDNTLRLQYSPQFLLWYWHRSLNPRKLIELNFSSLTRNMTLQRALKLNKLPQTTKTVGLRPMTVEDVPMVHCLLREHLQTFHLSPVLTQEDVQHWLLPQDGVIDTYVVESMDSTVTDMVSFYTLSSTVLNHPVHKSLKAACVLYCISMATPLLQLMEDILIICKAMGFDVFTTLDVMDTKAFLEPLKFRMGDVCKQYYLYNWRCPDIASDKVGIVLK
ncbi:glycylpeptide N-tetradecanoyltransferase 1b isoform X3 [Myxocyprinus asiaticus]|uniref:glycylpeptide N-tetradecanoyltransferase 1b isoform X3 n=1 Tax=Myxocyprinus asiaticus TaxID=70543 RepID=UPI002222B23E|nr:glycylpeptide N-tetradecanoyltransferase 1b isoform X3 [Myxocyprinus asiaticus]